MLASELMEKVRRIEIRTRRIVQNRTAGAWHASFKGRGIEFAEIREFQEGDEVRSIDWNVSARLGSPYIKLFTEEREQNVFFLVDRSASGQFGSGEMTKAEYTAEVAAVLAFSATLNKDRVGLLLFSDQEELHLDPARGHRHVLRIIRELLAFEPKSQKTDLAAGIEHLLKTTLKRSIVFILSDLITPEFDKPLRALSRKHEVILLHVTDPIERSLPNIPALSISDLETGEVTRLRRKDAQSLAIRTSEDSSALAKKCLRAGVDYVPLDTAVDYLPAIVGLFDKRISRR
ncbi:MAG: DUF58 domain-containing protein [Akkermansiaceae bacterium]|jgi:uncharacterized protein (DUF58 family)|nr:DUF58 domain-containing protein [Akkermansiaceae bacterium]MDG1071396.1 DUF58 domain-containing protein [Akkermansiaceae bacterium]MDG2324796.1 DUF58 domain-containing protein [Akkermansiaceae bacterium]